MDKVGGRYVFKIEEHVHVQRRKGNKRETDRSYKKKRVIDKARFLRRHEGMGYRTQVA